jgi:hypothetical protein
MRALRLLEVSTELWRLCSGLLASLKSVISATLLVIAAVYLFACLGVEAIATSQALRDDSAAKAIVDRRFGSLPQTIMTLMSFTTQDNIHAFYEPLVTANPWLALFFVLIWLFVTVSLMNLVTAVIVDSAINQSRLDQQTYRSTMRRQVARLSPRIEALFDELVESAKDGLLAFEELDFAELKIPAELKAIVEWDQLKDLFRNLDTGRSGTVDKEEFLDGVMHLALQSVPIETVQTLQLLRSQQRALVHMHAELRNIAESSLRGGSGRPSSDFVTLAE